MRHPKMMSFALRESSESLVMRLLVGEILFHVALSSLSRTVANLLEIKRVRQTYLAVQFWSWQTGRTYTRAERTRSVDNEHAC